MSILMNRGGPTAVRSAVSPGPCPPSPRLGRERSARPRTSDKAGAGGRSLAVAAALLLPLVAAAATADSRLPRLPVAPNPYPDAVWTMSDDAITTTSPSPYLTSPFVETKNPHTFSQAPAWTNDGRVLSSEVPDGGDTRIAVTVGCTHTEVFVSELDGSNATCLTCAQTGNDGDNGLPQERPQGDLILFASHRGHHANVGCPGLGGSGSGLWVMRPDGSNPVQLTGQTDPAALNNELTDDFHAYWSPDGTHVVWTHISANAAADGQDSKTNWMMRFGDFVDDGVNPPHLDNIVNVGPSGRGYETQPWAPDGSGFVFTASDDGGSGQDYFMRLYGSGATPLHPLVEKLTTDDNPSWNEQALLTPDMSALIYMSSRECHDCLYNTQTQLGMQVGLKGIGIEDMLTAPVFVVALVTGLRTELYLLDLHTKAVRRLTSEGGLIPEFFWDSQGKTLLWTTFPPFGQSTPLSTSTASFQLPGGF